MNINRKFNDLCDSPTRRSIYKVHNQYLQNSNDNVYEPAIAAIGPYHRGKQRLKMIEELKLRYLKSLLLRKNENVDTFISAAAEIEQEARNCYAEAVILTTAEFIEMLVLDACFIVELLRKSHGRDSGDDRDRDRDHDPIFQMAWILNSLRRDLILFENQIPFFVLCKMFDLIINEPNQHQKLIQMFSVFYGIEKLHRSNWKNNTSPKEVKHLLHLMHATSRPSSHSYINLNACPLRREFRLIPSATDLKDANVRFRKSEADAAFEVEFKKGTLTMPALTIQDWTESFYRNLIVYEQYFPDNQPTYVTDYVVILDCLVNTLGDVEVLSGCGIIDNMVGDNQVAADVINRLAHSVLLSETYFIYADTFGLINAHCKRRWNRARAALNRDYFNTPWAYISFFAAVLLMLLTLAQTVFSALQVW